MKKVTLDSILAYLMYSKYSYAMYKADAESELNKINDLLQDDDVSIPLSWEKLFSSSSSFENRDDLVVSMLEFKQLQQLYEESLEPEILEKLDVVYSRAYR